MRYQKIIIFFLSLVCISTGCVKMNQSDRERDVAISSPQNLPLFGNKVLFFGDSITEFTYKGKGLVDYFREASGTITYNSAVGGSRFSQRKTPTLTPKSEAEARAALDMCNMVKAWVNNDFALQDAANNWLISSTAYDYTPQICALKDIQISDIDYIIIGGGGDYARGIPFGSEDDSVFTTINGAINSIVGMLLAAKPSVKIVFYSGCVSYYNNIRDDEHWSDNYVYSAYDKTKPQLIDLIEKQVSSWNVPYINLYRTLDWNQQNFSNYFLLTDGTHPYKGFGVLGYRIYQEVLTIFQSSDD